jgi:hypothetical protein
MDEKLFTLKDLRAAFIAGEAFESDTYSVDLDKKPELTEPDFGEWVKKEFNIDVK